MADYTIQHDRPNCIGCTACAATAPAFWEMGADGLSNLKGAKKNAEGNEELAIEQKDYAVNKQAADSCPVNVIHIIDKAGKKII
ncbi:4Fe-4S single cluster domain protein [uncultured archaeon]|nr:4Fe-4S single cluster domain protein [uncultured archaeon]